MNLTPPEELAVVALLHRMADGGSVPGLIQQIADEALTTMRDSTRVVGVVLGEPDIGYVVHATSTAPGTPAVSSELLTTGPALAAATTGAMTTVNDMSAPDQRWATHADLAVAQGLRGVRCWAIQVGQRPVGALVVHTSDEWGTGRPNAAGYAFADLCAVVLQLPAESDRWVQAASHLHAALMDEVSTHQAVGMVAGGLETDIPTAAARLAAHADRVGITRLELARRLVDGTQDPRGIDQ